MKREGQRERKAFVKEERQVKKSHNISVRHTEEATDVSAHLHTPHPLPPPQTHPLPPPQTHYEKLLHLLPLMLLAVGGEDGSGESVDSDGQTVDVVLVSLE